jgi:two-component system, chemotaxis family, CheB/CheR fusion protein
MSPVSADGIDPLLEYLKSQRGFDFTGYKRSTLERRIVKRMQAVGAEDHEAYLDHLELHQDEFALLFNTILINVTSFFRDPEAWDHLAAAVLPALIESKPASAPIRVWSAGCASGEEAYTIAMLLAEQLGVDGYQERVKIYATDLDDDALDVARQATYGPDALEPVPEEFVERYFERTDGRYSFHKDLRRAVIFGRNDLVQDAPISRIDLLLCRNTLMYFNAETQARILRRFNFALNPDGVLFVGKSEMLITHSELFTPSDLKHRVFTKVPPNSLRERLLGALPVDGGAERPTPAAARADGRLRESAFESAAVAQLLVDRAGVLQYANQQARGLVGVHPPDVGRALKDLEVSYRPVELRSHLEQVQTSRRPTAIDGVTVVSPHGERRFIDVQLTPLLDGDDLLGASITFTDVTTRHQLQEELEHSRRELENSYEELQSTVEELETTNEELQSTNEELETTNEELQSTNEELETINDELRQRTLQLNDVNAFLETILSSLRLSVAVLDRSLKVQIWNAQSEEIWGLRSAEAEGEFFLGLDIGLPVDRLKHTLRAALDGRAEREELTLQATNRRGRPITCSVTILPMGGLEEPSGVILLMQELSGEAAETAAAGDMA